MRATNSLAPRTLCTITWSQRTPSASNSSSTRSASAIQNCMAHRPQRRPRQLRPRLRSRRRCPLQRHRLPVSPLGMAGGAASRIRIVRPKSPIQTWTMTQTSPTSLAPIVRGVTAGIVGIPMATFSRGRRGKSGIPLLLILVHSSGLLVPATLLCLLSRHRLPTSQ